MGSPRPFWHCPCRCAAGQMGDPVMHIELRRWADALVVAPLSANSLAKMAHGLADNLLTCIVRAWDFTNPLVVSKRPWFILGAPNLADPPACPEMTTR
jgi:hypothetical protein